MIYFLAEHQPRAGLFPASSVFPDFLHITIAVGLVAGGARMLWLFLSPVPRPMPETVTRRRFLTIGKFAPLLMVVGCVCAAVAVGIVLLAASWPRGWWNLFPYLAMYAFALASASAFIAGIVVQTTLVDAHRGFDPATETGNLQRNFEAALLVLFALATSMLMNFDWLPDLDWSTVAQADAEQYRLAVRAPALAVILAAVIRMNRAAEDSSLPTKKGYGYLTLWAAVALSIAIDWTLDAIVPEDRDIERYIRDRGDPIALTDVTLPLPTPPDFHFGEMLAMVALSLLLTTAVVTTVDLLARRGVATAFVPRRVWPALLFLCLALSGTYVLAQGGATAESTSDWAAAVALPLILGMGLARLFPLLARVVKATWRYARKKAGHGLPGQFLIFLLLTSLAAILLIAAAQLSALVFGLFWMVGCAAISLGWSHSAPAASTRPEILAQTN